MRSCIWARMPSMRSFIALASASVISWYVFFSGSIMIIFLAPASTITAPAAPPPPRRPPPLMPSMRTRLASNDITAVPDSPSAFFRS